MVEVVGVVGVVGVVYRYEENFGVKGPKSNKSNKKDVCLPMTMPQAAGKNKCRCLNWYAFFGSLYPL